MSFTDTEDAAGGGFVVSSRTAIEAATRGEIDIQISTARAYPRSIVAFKRTALELACLDEETAATMFYNLPRGGKRIEGPSVRLAEVVVYAWGNLRARAYVLSVDETFVTARGEAFDLERNVAAQHEVKRRITDKAGKRFNEDMIIVTSNAACSIAYREAVFKVVPRALFKDILDQAKLASVGKADSMSERRVRALEWFAKAGAAADRIFASLGVRGIEDLTVDHLIALNGLRTAIRDGDLTIESAFPLPGDEGGSTSTTSAADRLRAQAAARQAAPASRPDLDGVGLTGDLPAVAPAPAPADDDLPPAAPGKLAAFAALVADTKPAGKQLATEEQRGRVRRLAMSLAAHDEPTADVVLAMMDKLSGAQAQAIIRAGFQAAAEVGAVGVVDEEQADDGRQA